MVIIERWGRGWQLLWAWPWGAWTSHDPHKPTRTDKAEISTTASGPRSSAASSVHRSGSCARRTGARLSVFFLPEPIDAGKQPHQATANAEDRIAADQAAGRNLRQTESYFASSCRYHRKAATRSHRRTRIAGHGGQHSFTHRESLADEHDSQRQYVEHRGLVGIHQFRCKFYYRNEAFGIFPESRNRRDQAGRQQE